MSDSDDEPQLSVHALAALQDFYKEQKAEEEKLQEALSGGDGKSFQPKEDWQLSQFWYDDRTAETLAKEALSTVGECGRIACLSSPTAYKKLQELKPATVSVKCLEFDERFQVFGEDFVMYDYNEPLKLNLSLKQAFDLVIADPPFLSEECLTKTAVTIKYLTTEKIILCTGAVMTDLAQRLLNVTRCKFEPSHSNGLQNEFACFSNYDASILNS